MSPLAMAEWIEIGNSPCTTGKETSPLAMAEWIEIPLPSVSAIQSQVSASDGGVD